MRLYHSRPFVIYRLVGVLFILFLFSGCTLSQTTEDEIRVTVQADGEERLIRLAGNSTVQEALKAAEIELDNLDRVEPASFTILSDGAVVDVTRIREEMFEEEEVIPFERQTVKNESMPAGDSRIVQVGVNGVEVVTWRRMFEDGKEVSLQVLRRSVAKEAQPEIIMVGSQSPFASFDIPGQLVYLIGGNAWVIEGKTNIRRPVVTTGDLDGRVFSLSPRGDWLLFTRKSEEEDQINSLWAARVDEEGAGLMVDLQVANIIHFAEFNPFDPTVIAYSTVEPRPSPPGWQANNDLGLIRLRPDGETRMLTVELETNMGGKYGWWGMDFAWSPDGKQMAYTRPDSLGLLSLGEEELDDNVLTGLLDVLAFQTGSDWAWVPGVSWGPDGNVIYTIDHAPDPAVSTPEESQLFDLTAIPLTVGLPLRLVSQVGMFAYPLPSPVMSTGETANEYKIAYLHAIFPQQSESSRYRLAIIDRDGSDRVVLFPEEGAPGLEPYERWGAWSPAPMEDDGYALAVIYQNNLWVINSDTGETRQITGDNLVTRVDWK